MADKWLTFHEHSLEQVPWDDRSRKLVISETVWKVWKLASMLLLSSILWSSAIADEMWSKAPQNISDLSQLPPNAVQISWNPESQWDCPWKYEVCLDWWKTLYLDPKTRDLYVYDTNNSWWTVWLQEMPDDCSVLKWLPKITCEKRNKRLELEASIAESEASIAESDASIAESDASIAESDASIAESDARIRELDESIGAAFDQAIRKFWDRWKGG